MKNLLITIEDKIDYVLSNRIRRYWYPDANPERKCYKCGFPQMDRLLDLDKLKSYLLKALSDE